MLLHSESVTGMVPGSSAETGECLCESRKIAIHFCANFRPDIKPDAPWYRAHQTEVSQVIRCMLEESERSNARCRRTRSTKVELEVLDPGFLPLAEAARTELLLSLESFIVQWMKERGHHVPPDATTVSLTLPAKAPIVTCIKICMTRVPPSFDLLVPNACNWHELRCKLGRWLWKSIKNEMTDGLAGKLFGKPELQLTMTFNMSSTDMRAVPLTGQRLFDIMWAIMGPACVALGEFCSTSHTASDHRSKISSVFLLDDFFMKFLAQRVIFLVEKIQLEKAEEAIKEESEMTERKRKRNDEEERPKRRRLERRDTSDNLREQLENLRRTERMRLESSELPDWEVPARMDPTPNIPALLKWKAPESMPAAANGYKLPADAGPFPPKPISDFDWEVTTGVLKFLRDRGINVLVSTTHNIEFQIDELIHTASDPFDTSKAAKSVPKKNQRRKARLHSLLEGDIQLGAPDPHAHLFSMPEFKAFVSGQVHLFHDADTAAESSDEHDISHYL